MSWFYFWNKRNPQDWSQIKKERKDFLYRNFNKQNPKNTKEVRLKNAYIIKGESLIKNNDGTIKEIICSYDPKSKSGSDSEESKRKVKGTIHWVTIKHSLVIDVNVYDRLFSVPSPDSDKQIDFKSFINSESLKKVKGYIEPSISTASKGDHFQFQRLGYFILDNIINQKLIFNKTVGLRDSWSKK